MPSNRREFLTRAARVLGSGALCTCAAAPEDLRANVAWPGKLFGKAPFAKVKWFNEPASATQSGDQLVVRTKPKTDYWRHDYVPDNGHFFFLPVIVSSRKRRPYPRVLRLVHHPRYHHERTAVVAHRPKRLFPRGFLLSRRQKLHLHAPRLSSYAGFRRCRDHVPFARRSGLRIDFRPNPFDALTRHRPSGKEHGHAHIPWTV